MTHRVVVVGGGFGGLPACRYLGELPVEVTLIDRRNHHLFQPLLYQVATGILSQGQIAPPLRHVLRKHKNVKVELAEVDDFDLDRRVVIAKRLSWRPMEIPYDSLIVAAGASQSYFGHDEFALFAPGMKTIDDALELRRRIFGAFEMAEISSDADEQRAWLTVVVVGAGPTGVELAGQVRELASRSLRGDFRTFDPRSMRVLVVDGGDEPLATFGSNLSKAAARELHGLGVELQMGARVTGVDMMGVDVTFKDGSTDRITARTVIWAAGVQASPLAAKLATACGAQVDHAGRIEVLPDLTLPGHPEVFAVGDMTSLDGLPGVAEVAMQGSLHAAHTIGRRLRGLEDAKRFRYRDLGSVATIGRFRAIFSWRGIRLSGVPAWMVWAFVHLAFLNGFASRFTTMMRWIRWMVGTNRVERAFSVGHTGGDLSAPESVRQQIMPTPFPEINAIVPPPDQPS
ncbi:MAG TPA: NAD(P)/FAD-dependent oxidoreductase [Acidimicrobiia bacterium]|nr:NAD(P)/FAD-dependent oxidoreductase [Acidimicrobiia bacterium]